MTARKVPERTVLLAMAKRLVSAANREGKDQEGDLIVTSSGKVGRITRCRMCGSAPEGMTPCHDIEWEE